MGKIFKLDHAGIASLLKSEAFASAVESTAERIAEEVRPQVGDKPVEVEPYETDRAAARVVIADPAGKALQAKHGVLTKAAASVGLEVKSRR